MLLKIELSDLNLKAHLQGSSPRWGGFLLNRRDDLTQKTVELLIV